ncbi:MAG: hypothetical protein DWQ34_13185 [Planctomycetota bacterium]|nr:MAG: hypothetical protein DWQ34_13185 [Planctomycetota bacterium]REK28046.1 MAG: hypothetical protein DWQ41_06435 [Planctomycetota bacterium]REK37573.1 MAG: hypothetical protein DWQ45_06120 [Planctomycetota bacterium]
MKLITHMEPSQLRLGYLCCLSLVAGRQLDTRQALVDRLGRFVFQMIDEADPRWPEFAKSVDRNELQRMRTPVDEKTAELHELFGMTDTSAPAYQLQALWLSQRDIPSHLGLLTEKNATRILEMGRSFELLTTGYALSEKGVFLNKFLQATMPGVLDGAPTANPFAIARRPALQLFLLYALLSVDILTPFLLKRFASSQQGDPSNSPKLLPQAANDLVDSLVDVTDISNVESLRSCRQFAERLQSKAVARNQAQPRYHHLFELGLVDRSEADDGGRRVVPYVATDAGSRAASVFQTLREDTEQQLELIDTHFFHWAAEIYDFDAKPCDGDLRRLYYFARGFPYLEREIGFTPGRTIALAGCLLGLEEGWIIEIAEMFSVLRTMAAGPWRPYLEYSGGSRLDQEFLIKVKPGLIDAIEEQLPPTSQRERTPK